MEARLSAIKNRVRVGVNAFLRLYHTAIVVALTQCELNVLSSQNCQALVQVQVLVLTEPQIFKVSKKEKELFGPRADAKIT